MLECTKCIKKHGRMTFSQNQLEIKSSMYIRTYFRISMVCSSSKSRVGTHWPMNSPTWSLMTSSDSMIWTTAGVGRRDEVLVKVTYASGVLEVAAMSWYPGRHVRNVSGWAISVHGGTVGTWMSSCIANAFIWDDKSSHVGTTRSGRLGGCSSTGVGRCLGIIVTSVLATKRRQSTSWMNAEGMTRTFTVSLPPTARVNIWWGYTIETWARKPLCSRNSEWSSKSSQSSVVKGSISIDTASITEGSALTVANWPSAKADSWQFGTSMQSIIHGEQYV